MRNRLKRPAISTGSTVLISFIPTALAFTAMLYFGQNLDRSIGIAGSVFAVLTFALQQIQSRNPPSRKIVFLAKSRSSFARNIARGLVDAVSAQTSIQVRSIYPDKEPADAVSWQIAQIDTKEIRDADAVILIPAGDDEKLWQRLANLQRVGTAVIAVDVKPPNRIFGSAGVARPYFVGSDFALGGERVAELLGERLMKDATARALLVVGPDSSWPARERGSRMLYRLSALNLIERISTVYVNSWGAVEAAERIVAEIERVRGESGGTRKTYIFCGNDKILVATFRRMLAVVPKEELSQYLLVGYDGATNEDDSLVVAECANVIATVDTVPLQQGRVAGEYVLDVYDGRTAPPVSRYTEPSLQLFDSR